MGVGSSKPEDVDESKINKEDDPAGNSETTEDSEMPTNRSGKEIGTEDDDESSDEEKETVVARRPGLIPFTSVPVDNSLADDLLKKALVYGWLARRAMFDRLPTDRWCALHNNFIYEFEDELGEMVLKAKVNLKGCVCYEDEGLSLSFQDKNAINFSFFFQTGKIHSWFTQAAFFWPSRLRF